jgi:hypothetical protein
LFAPIVAGQASRITKAAAAWLRPLAFVDPV